MLLLGYTRMGNLGVGDCGWMRGGKSVLRRYWKREDAKGMLQVQLIIMVILWSGCMLSTLIK